MSALREKLFFAIFQEHTKQLQPDCRKTSCPGKMADAVTPIAVDRTAPPLVRSPSENCSLFNNDESAEFPAKFSEAPVVVQLYSAPVG